MRSARVAVVVVLLGSLFAPSAVGEPFSDKTDIIYKRPSGTMPEQGTGDVIRVKNETFESITITLKTLGEITIPSKDLDRIEHFDAPAEFGLGMGALGSKDFEQAVAYFDKVKDFPRPWAKVYVLFYKAEALRKWGVTDKQKNADAVELYNKLITTHPNNIFKAKALLGSAVARVQEDKYDDARTALDKMKTDFFGTRWETVADLWLGRILEREGKPKEAARIYVRIARSEDPEIKREGQIGEIRCLKSQEKYDLALEKARAFVQENTDPRVLGGAWNIIGDCHMANARKGGQDEIRQALLAYLRVVVVYFFDSQTAARGAFKAGECFEELKQPKRAVDQYRRAAETAGGGDWVAKAQERLKAIE